MTWWDDKAKELEKELDIMIKQEDFYSCQYKVTSNAYQMLKECKEQHNKEILFLEEQ
jgi:hypothetical protein